ncbi:class I SAM-dependent methyltransferase [Bradyrhizobium sp.]|uniref:class I SAM-dependent methyltransferase n=1 Tax=Bradyrhizobium sp. TaxID=376 RepID=UPI003C742C2C
MIAHFLQVAFRSFVHTGDFSVSTADGGNFRVGDGTGKPLAIRFMSASAELAVLLDPDLRFAELYVDGDIVLEQGSLAGLLAMLLSQDRTANPTRWAKPQWLMRYIGRRLKQFNSRDRAKANVAHHYDLNGKLYSIFLDASRQYSCAYFENPDQTLEEAQLAKLRHLAAKLLLGPGRRVLDIGSGWGGLGCYLAGSCGAQVDGVTLSVEQFEYSCVRARDAGYAGKIRFLLKDYRDLHQVYDRIVSVGMFEHVGRGFYNEFFQKCYELLSDDGVFVLHSCGRSDGPGITNPWLAKYIFPGGYIPALSEVLPAIERAGFLVTDIEILRLHYADTLKEWRERFSAKRGEVSYLYDERFCRMWELYLVSSEMAFREEGMMVFQIQMTKTQGVVPNTRNYIPEGEAHLRGKKVSRRIEKRIA